MNRSIIKRLESILSKTQQLKEDKLWAYTDGERIQLMEVWIDELIKDIDNRTS